MLTTVFLAAVTAAAPAAFTSPQWTLVDPDARVTTYLGQPALFLNSGIAVIDAQLADGTIEFDVALHGHPSFAGVLFRAESNRDYELIYLRPHRTRQPDALQYTPIFNDQEAWQLYNGEGYTAASELPLNRWVHVRLVITGYTARLFVDAAQEPQLIVTDLKRPWRRGRIGLWGRGGGAHFSNVRVTDASGTTQPQRTSVVFPPGTIEQWQLSPAYPASTMDPLEPPRIPAGAASWQAVSAEGSGLVNIARYRSKVSADGDVVFARTVVRAHAAKRIRLTFGYSDEISILLNGRLLFTGRSAYLSRDASFLGTLTLGNDAVYLDVQPGDNEVIAAVVERFGGWGIAARIE
jgi:hypothetical protein